MHATERHTPTPRGKMSRRNETGPRRTQASHASNVRTHHANLLHRGVPSPYASGAGDVHSLSLALSAALAGKEQRVRCMGDGGRRACVAKNQQSTLFTDPELMDKKLASAHINRFNFLQTWNEIC